MSLTGTHCLREGQYNWLEEGKWEHLCAVEKPVDLHDVSPPPHSHRARTTSQQPQDGQIFEGGEDCELTPTGYLPLRVHQLTGAPFR
jgi:hypothetical protein